MKKLLSIVLTIIIMSPLTVCADEDYITIDPYPYSTHVLGEDIIVKGNTNLQFVTLGLYYPEDQGYKGYIKFALTLTRDEFKRGYTLKTEPLSRPWPEGVWTIVVQSGDYRDELKLNMTASPVFDRNVKIATYENNTLTNLQSYNTRGILVHDNITSFTTEDNITVKIFSWNNFSPTTDGESTIFVTLWDESYLIDIKTYHGIIKDYGNHLCLDMGNGDFVKLFYWHDNLTPIE